VGRRPPGVGPARGDRGVERRRLPEKIRREEAANRRRGRRAVAERPGGGWTTAEAPPRAVEGWTLAEAPPAPVTRKSTRYHRRPPASSPADRPPTSSARGASGGGRAVAGLRRATRPRRASHREAKQVAGERRRAPDELRPGRLSPAQRGVDRGGVWEPRAERGSGWAADPPKRPRNARAGRGCCILQQPLRQPLEPLQWLQDLQAPVATRDADTAGDGLSNRNVFYSYFVTHHV
jgi:hypothetical protein